ncbi:hypothetical protein ACFL5Q_03445 [Planctomycetota bacterium]
MDLLNRLLTICLDGFLLPWRSLSPIWGLAAVSTLAGVVMVWIFGKVSPQRRIGALRTRIEGHLLEIWLFRESTRVALAAEARVFYNTMKYLLALLPALMVLMVPVVPLMAHLQARYGYLPLAAGESTVVRVVYRQPTSAEAMDVRLDVPDGLALETPPLRIPTTGEVDFRVGTLREGDYTITVRAGEQKITKTVRVGPGQRPLSPVRGGSLLDRLLYPVEAAVPKGPVASVRLDYPQRDVAFFGFEVHWIWPFLILSLVAGFLVKGFLKVKL